MIFGVVLLHVWAFHTTGNNNPTGINPKSKQDTLPFHPYYTMKDLFAIVVFMILFAYFVFYVPNYMGHADNYIEANPLVTPAHIVPEWYFLPFYAILRAVPDKLGGVILMFGAIAVLFVLPWLDTSKVRSGTYRPLFKQFFWVFAIVAVALGYLGAMPPEGGYVIAARICTAYYFAHFLIILPLLGFIEKPKPLPNSISESVLGSGSGKPAGAVAAPETK
jgi:ubiquinol-cytochrome c reductase cytochrome b subunit